MPFRSLALLLSIVSMLQSTAVWADTLNVPSGAYLTVQSAIDAALDGDVIAIAPGTYVGNLVVFGKALTLQSDFATSNDWSDVLATVLQGEEVLDDNGTPADPGDDFLTLGNVLELKAASSKPSDPPTQVNLIGLSFADGESGVLVRPNVLADLSDVRVVGNQDGLELEGRGGATHGLARAIVRRSVFEFNGDDGVDVDQRAELWIEDSWIQDNDDDGIEIRLQDSEFAPGEQAEHVILRNHMLRNGEDGLQLIDDQTLTPRSFRVERNVFADNVQAGLGMMCNQVSAENYEGCPIDEPVRLVHNTFARNDHGLTGGADLIGVNNIFVDHVNIGVKNVVAPGSSLHNSLFDGNGLDAENSNVVPAQPFVADPLLGDDFALGAGSPAVDAGMHSLVVATETILDADPCEYRGAGPDLGAFELDTGPALLEVRNVALAADADDALEKKGKVKTSSKKLKLGSSKANTLAGLRFEAVMIEPGAEILAAYLELVTAKKDKKPADYLIHGEASDDALPFSEIPNDLSSRAATSASAAWSPPLWPESGVVVTTADLTALVQEIVDRPGWDSGNALALFVTGIGKRAILAHEKGAGAAVLHVELAADGSACSP